MRCTIYWRQRVGWRGGRWFRELATERDLDHLSLSHLALRRKKGCRWLRKCAKSSHFNSFFQVLIHGSGVVRAGQWTRKLIMNEDLDHGSVLPFLRFNLKSITLSFLIYCTFILSQGGEGERLGSLCDEHKPQRH